MNVDPSIPKSFVRDFIEANPSYRTGRDEVVDALFNPSIEAKPQYAPTSLRIKEVKNREVRYKWAFDRNGQNPNHTRVEQLRSDGWDYATTGDVVMAVESTVLGETEIRNGDLRLMKIPVRRYLEIEKSRLMQAIHMTRPQRMTNREGENVMSTNMVPGVRSEIADVNDPQVASIAAKAVFSDASKDLSSVMEGGRPSGNASKVSLHKGA